MAGTAGKRIVAPETANQMVVRCALISAITWRVGPPSSTTDALIFSLVGAGIATSNPCSRAAATAAARPPAPSFR
ncbi:MAG: hypothetical protein ACR2J8_13595 [Thermomicrobiales bacterium]